MSDIREQIAAFVRQAYINGYNARCRGETWENDDGTVALPERLILIDTLQILSIPQLVELLKAFEELLNQHEVWQVDWGLFSRESLDYDPAYKPCYTRITIRAREILASWKEVNGEP